MQSSVLLLIACLFQLGEGYVVASGRQAIARPHAGMRPRLETPNMKSQEDKEFEEWMRQKKIASGVDPDEDFAAGRSTEKSIFAVGGEAAALYLLRALRRPNAVTRFHAVPTAILHRI